MELLVIGLAGFLGAHSLAMFPGAKAFLAGRLGAGPYKGLYSLISLVGFGLIIWGFGAYRDHGMIHVWSPPPWGRALAIPLMWAAFVSLACSLPLKGRLRGWLRHPLLTGATIWALAHLLANGDAGGMALFGAFLIWALADRLSLARRGDVGAPAATQFALADALAVVVGTAAFMAMLMAHRWLIGVSVLAA